MLKRTAIGALLTSTCVLTSPQAFADEDGKNDRYDPTYSAIRLGSVEADFSNIDRAFNLGFTLGIRIPGLEISGTEFLSAEIDLSSTLIAGENSGGAGGLGNNCDNGGGSDDGGGLGGIGDLIGGGGDGGGGGGDSCSASSDNDDLRLNSVAVFAKARTPGRFYGLARLGYRFVESTINELEDEQTGSAWGLGGGYQYSESGGAVELGYTQYGSDLSFIELVISY